MILGSGYDRIMETMRDVQLSIPYWVSSTLPMNSGIMPKKGSMMWVDAQLFVIKSVQYIKCLLS